MKEHEIRNDIEAQVDWNIVKKISDKIRSPVTNQINEQTSMVVNKTVMGSLLNPWNVANPIKDTEYYIHRDLMANNLYSWFGWVK